MKTLLIFTSIIVLATGCASNKSKNAGAPPAPVVTESGAATSPMTSQPIILNGSSTTGYTTASQPGQTPNNGWYTIQAPHQ